MVLVSDPVPLDHLHRVQQHLGIVGIPEQPAQLKGVLLVCGQPEYRDVAGLASGLPGGQAEDLLGDHVEPCVGEAESDEHQMALGPQVADQLPERSRAVGLPVLARPQHDGVALLEDAMGIKDRAGLRFAEHLPGLPAADRIGVLLLPAALFGDCSA